MEKTIYNGKEFNYYQITEIILGELSSAIRVSIYAKPEFSHEQMREIRLGLESCETIDWTRLGSYAYKLVESYAKPEFSHEQMRERRLKINSILDICNKYDIEYFHPNGSNGYFVISRQRKSNYSYAIMHEILDGLDKGLDVTIYAKPEFNAQQMSQIRQGLKKGLDVTIYAKPEYSASQMKEIKLSLLNQLEKC